ncbi:MAG: glycoside hydrolase family 88 protein [Ignavibacteriales bacterium]|nr:glycoside hydrolase family 88 protein [Ignavibacteriales bacterium]
MNKLKKYFYINIFYAISVIGIILFTFSYNNDSSNRSAAEIAKSIADRIISESTFETKSVTLQNELGIQVLDYNEFDNQENSEFYSITNIYSSQDTALKFGINYSGVAEIYFNKKKVFYGEKANDSFLKEIAYGIFDFTDTFTVDLRFGQNEILCKIISDNQSPKIFLREIPQFAEDELTAEFKLNILGYKNLPNQWVNIGPITKSNSIFNEILSNKLQNSYKNGNETLNWKLFKEKFVEELVISETNTYQRESYLEWHYANGTVLFGLQALADVLNESKYSDFVNKAINYTLENFKLFKDQYFSKYAFRGSNHRLFRRTMLDDTGAPALPYLENYLETNNAKLKFLIDEMSEYVTHKQMRLNDGTFCRPEPTEMTIWADDLFMSVPFLLRMAKLTNDYQYYDDVSTQVINFYKYLFDEEMNLCKHAWFSSTNEKSLVFWGRANGWMLWAVSETLLNLPHNHKDYNRILELYQNHINGIKKYQNANGMWHQVLNKKESFEETSCTAMYIIAISRGIENKWLNNEYKAVLEIAWMALKNNISDNGIVKDICRGTSVGFDYDFYFNRKRFDNDPRGLGAVLTACSEMIKYGY